MFICLQYRGGGMLTLGLKLALTAGHHNSIWKWVWVQFFVCCFIVYIYKRYEYCFSSALLLHNVIYLIYIAGVNTVLHLLYVCNNILQAIISFVSFCEWWCDELKKGGRLLVDIYEFNFLRKTLVILLELCTFLMKGNDIYIHICLNTFVLSCGVLSLVSVICLGCIENVFFLKIIINSFRYDM